VDPEVGGSRPPSCTTRIGGWWHIIREKLSCFKTYDVRGRVGFDLDEKIAYRIGRAFAQHLGARRIAIGCDARLSSPSLKAATIEGIMDAVPTLLISA
jgi:phosphomannomutase